MLLPQLKTALEGNTLGFELNVIGHIWRTQEHVRHWQRQQWKRSVEWWWLQFLCKTNACCACLFALKKKAIVKSPISWNNVWMLHGDVDHLLASEWPCVHKLKSCYIFQRLSQVCKECQFIHVWRWLGLLQRAPLFSSPVLLLAICYLFS